MPIPTLPPRVYYLQWLLVCSLVTVFCLLPETFFARLPFDLCLIKLLTGHDCPGCGSLRGFSHLAHGHWLAAWQSNPLVFVWVMLLLCLEGYWLYNLVTYAKKPVA